eukprot:TRINITY_DN2323_c0_g1_i1.p1 TRINITY_DN2323_c0_g1~~TRINITY_DN2323_c0_g1_i1.p1  ORF type:complete len:444 (-),score=35.48 TRINITY_DN2323_c0_g1_i1:89-1420(-)
MDERVPLLKVGDVVPKIEKRFSSTPSLIGIIFVVWICCTIASGPLNSFPTLVPLLMEEKVFEGENQQFYLSLIYTMSFSIASSLQFFTGVAYDTIGARGSGTLGALLCSIGMFALAIGVRFPSANFLLFFGFPWTYQMGMLNSFCLFGFVWFFPRHQTLLMGIGNSSYQASVGLAIFYVYLDQAGYELIDSFLIFGILTVIAAAIVFPLIPSQDLILYKATQVDSNFEPTPQLSIPTLIKKLYQEIMKNRLANALFFSYVCLINLLFVYFIGNLYPFLFALSGGNEEKTVEMVTYFSIIFAVTGGVGSIVLGFVCDRIGLRYFLGLSNLVMVGFICCIFRDSVVLEYLSLVLISVMSCIIALLGPRWSIYYTTPQYFGSFYGMQNSISGLFQFFMVWMIPKVTQFYTDGVYVYWVPFSVIFGFAITIGISLNLYLYFHPPKET